MFDNYSKKSENTPNDFISIASEFFIQNCKTTESCFFKVLEFRFSDRESVEVPPTPEKFEVLFFSFEVLSLVTQIVPELYHRVFPAKIFINSFMVKNQIKSFLLIKKHKSIFYNHQFVVQGLSAAPLFSQHAPSFSLGQLQAPCYGFFLVSDTFRLI